MQNRKIWSIGVLILVCAMLLVGLQRIQSIETSEIAEMTEPEADALDPLKDAEQQLDALVAIGEAVTSNPFRISKEFTPSWIWSRWKRASITRCFDWKRPVRIRRYGSNFKKPNGWQGNHWRMKASIQDGMQRYRGWPGLHP